MNHEPVLENFSSATVNTQLNTIIYFNPIKYLNTRLRQIYYTDLKLKIKVQKIKYCTIAVKTQYYCVGN